MLINYNSYHFFDYYYVYFFLNKNINFDHNNNHYFNFLSLIFYNNYFSEYSYNYFLKNDISNYSYYYMKGYNSFFLSSQDILLNYNIYLDMQGNLWWYWFKDDVDWNYADYYEYVHNKKIEYKINQNCDWFFSVIEFFEKYNKKIYIHNISGRVSFNYYPVRKFVFYDYLKNSDIKNRFISGFYSQDGSAHKLERENVIYYYNVIDFYKNVYLFFYNNAVKYLFYDDLPYTKIDLNYILKLNYLNSFNNFYDNGLSFSFYNNFFFNNLFSYDISVFDKDYLNYLDYISFLKKKVDSTFNFNIEIKKFKNPFFLNNSASSKKEFDFLIKNLKGVDKVVGRNHFFNYSIIQIDNRFESLSLDYFKFIYKKSC